MSDNPFEELVKDQVPNKNIRPIVPKGFQWLTMLIEYDLDGNATVIRSFSRPAKDSDIKGLVKTKKEDKDKIILKKNNDSKTEELWDE